MRTIFQDRVRCAIADQVASGMAVLLDSDTTLRARMSLSTANLEDAPRAAISLISAAAKAKDQEDRAGSILSAFWHTHRHQVKFQQGGARLFINPPDNLEGAEQGCPHTVHTQKHLNGAYGPVYSGVEFKKLSATQIDGVHGPFFDDIALFWDAGIPDITPLFERILPGTTISIFRPSVHHAYWLGWAGLDLTFRSILSKSPYDLKVVFELSGDDVETIVYGIESKGS